MPTATSPLFTANDLNALPGVSGVSNGEAVLVESIVWGWLKPVLGLEARPEEPSDELRAWALELGAIYRANPDGLSSYESGGESSSYDGKRREQILTMAANGGTSPGTGRGPRSRGSFPPAQCYPDPARRPAGPRR